MKRIFIQVPVDERTKRAFSMWCEVNNTTMAEKVKELIRPMVVEGEAVLNKIEGGDRND